MPTSAASLPIAAARGRPVATADTKLMEVPAALAGLFPEEGIRRGSTVAVRPGGGGHSLAMALVGPVTVAGQWVAAVGLPSMGLVAAAELGVRLDHLALIPDPGEHWAVIVAAVVDGMDVVLLQPPSHVRPGDARRLVARVRERGTVLVLLGGGWPESPDLHLSVEGSSWSGLGSGYGRVEVRQVEVSLSGRRVGGRERHRTVLLPGPGGGLQPALAPSVPAVLVS